MRHPHVFEKGKRVPWQDILRKMQGGQGVSFQTLLTMKRSRDGKASFICAENDTHLFELILSIK